MKASKIELIEELQKRVEDKILEPTNFELLKKMIERADTLDEAIMIAELGTTYKRTGFHFDKRLEKVTDTIKYFKKNEELSFVTDSTKKTHKLIIGDNYPALLNLLIEYKGAIDVIYIDPPYGKDSMGEFAETNYENAITRDNLLSMLYPRLLLAKNLLSANGVIFCSIDDKNQAYLKCLFDEVFDEKNTETMIWHKVDNDSGKLKVTHRFRCEHEYILVAYKNKEVNRFNKYLQERNYKNTYTNPDNDPRGPYKQGIISDTEEKSSTNSPNYYSITTPSGKVYTRRWRVSREEMEELINDNRIYFGKKQDSVPSLKVFINEKGLTTPVSILENLGTAKTAGIELNSIFNEEIFKYPKPKELIKHLIYISSMSNEIKVLDFFSGSGTTGQSVLELNKENKDFQAKFILVTNNEITDKNPNGIAYDVTTKRLKRVMTGECYDGTKDFKWLENNAPLGDNLDVYEIAEVANFESTEGKTPFDVIDETLYGVEKFATVQEKVEWVCDNFEITQKKLEEN